jgi:hypothetical protein
MPDFVCEREVAFVPYQPLLLDIPPGVVLTIFISTKSPSKRWTLNGRATIKLYDTKVRKNPFYL